MDLISDFASSDRRSAEAQVMCVRHGDRVTDLPPPDRGLLSAECGERRPESSNISGSMTHPLSPSLNYISLIPTLSYPLQHLRPP